MSKASSKGKAICNKQTAHEQKTETNKVSNGGNKFIIQELKAQLKRKIVDIENKILQNK